jgi:hypothetical protein
VKRLAVLVAAAVAVVAVLLVACAVFAPAWIVRHDLGADAGPALSAGDRLKAVNDVRATLLQGLAAAVALGGIGLGAVMTLRQIRVTREGQFIDRFSKAMDQLSSDHLGTRMGGVYAMEQIAEVAPSYRGPHRGPAGVVRQAARGLAAIPPDGGGGGPGAAALPQRAPR